MLKGVLLPVLEEVLKCAACFGISVVCCAVEAGAVTNRLAKSEMLALQVPVCVQKGCRSAARAEARLSGYSAVRALTRTFPCFRPAMDLCAPGAWQQVLARVRMDAKLAQKAQDL